MYGCAFCTELARIANRRPDMSKEAHDAAVEAVFDLAERVKRLHQAYGQKRRTRRS